MLKYLAASGIALSVLFFLSELGVNALGSMIKNKREVGVPIKIQLMSVIKNKQA